MPGSPGSAQGRPPPSSSSPSIGTYNRFQQSTQKTTAPQKFQPNTQVRRHTAQKITDTVRGDVLESDQRHRAALELNSGSQARIKFGAIGAWEGLGWRGCIRIWCRTRLDTMRRDRWRALHALYYIGHYTSAIVDVVSFERLPVGWCFKPYCTVN